MVLFADKASDDGSGIFASKVTMSDELDLSRRALITAIQGLVDDGIIYEVGTRPNGVIEYAIVLENLHALNRHESAVRRLKRCEGASHQRRSKGVKELHSGVKELHSGCEGASHKPLMNHPEPSSTIVDEKPLPKKRTSLPKNFTPELTGKAAEIANGWHSSRLAHELDAFRNYHLAKGSLMADWQAAFRTWIGNAEKWSKPNGNGNRDNRGSGNGLLDATLDEMGERGRFVR